MALETEAREETSRTMSDYAASAWIPCSERMPEKSGWYLILHGYPPESQWPPAAFFVAEAKRPGWYWKANGRGTPLHLVKLWRPLPANSTERRLSMTDHNAAARFEAAAALFYRATGMMAPGKSYPLPIPPPPDDERREAWDQWMLSRSWRDAMSRICDLESRIEELERKLEDLEP